MCTHAKAVRAGRADAMRRRRTTADCECDSAPTRMRLTRARIYRSEAATSDNL